MDKEQSESLDVLIRNAKRLQRLSKDILDVTMIESRMLKLNKEKLRPKRTDSKYSQRANRTAAEDLTVESNYYLNSK